MNLFEARQVDKNYFSHCALRGVSMHVPDGSIHGLLGPNGAGKTTLIRVINRIMAPDKGELLFNGERLGPQHMRQMGYLPEERGLYRKMKVGEQVLYLARLKGLSRHDALLQLRHWFNRFEMNHWWNKKVEELSKGMAQKVQFIVAVVHEPRLLIFDEPFSGFDPVNAAGLKSEVLELQKKGTTIILSTHDMASVEELCEHITLIDKAESILEGTVHELKQRFKDNEYEIQYHGSFRQLSQCIDGIGRVHHDNVGPEEVCTARITLPAATSGNDLLRKLLSCVEIHAFREVLPNMNDIFLQAVQQNSQQESHV